MPLKEQLSRLMRREAARNLYLAIPHDHVRGGQQDREALVAGRDYFRLWLAEMSLRSDREWFTTWHPAVHSLVSFQFGAVHADVPNIVGEQGLRDIDAAHLNRVISLNYPLTALMPFSGGVVEVTVALLAMEGQDYLKRFIKVLGDFAGLVAVPQLSAALIIAAPVADGIEELLGGTDGAIHLGLHQSFVHQGGGANELRPAYYAAIRATEGEIDPATLWVDKDRLRQGLTLEQSKPFEGHAYLLLRVQKETERDDWAGLTAFMDPFGKAIEELGRGHRHSADEYYLQAIAAVVGCTDLTQADRYRVARNLKERYEQTGEFGLRAVPAGGSLAEELSEGVAAIPVDYALARGEPRLAQFLPGVSAGWEPGGLA